MSRLPYALSLVLIAVACGDNIRPATSADGGVDSVQADASPDAPPDGPPVNGSQQIADALATADGSGLDLPITGVTVTYLKPQLGNTTNDPAGFTVQAEQAGPAIFIAVDPLLLVPPAVRGDVVSFTITELATVGGQKRATAIEDFSRASQGADVGALAQDITAAADLVSAIGNYDSEIIDVTGTVAGNFAISGNSFEAASIDTTGLTGDANYQLRVPATLRSSLELEAGCTFTLDNTPVGRFNANTQLAAFVAGDITVTSCPAPTVVSAVAVTALGVRITFSRNLLASSVETDGSQFTFDNSLTASAAVVTGNTVLVTTSAQTPNETYTVTVANTVTDLAGTGVGTPNTATFAGFVTPAVVRINEVNANITGGCDLIELRVISGGSMTGFKVNERRGQVGDNEMSFTFGSLDVLTNQIVVLHLNGNSATCNPNGATSESLTTLDQPLALFTSNFDTAFDWYSTDTGLVATDNVITLFDAVGAIMDVVLLDDNSTASTANPPNNVATGSEVAAAAALAAGQWENDDGTTPAGGYLEEDYRLNAVLDLDATGTTRAGESIRRIDDTDDNNKADWLQGGSTWGLLNVGQSLLP